MLDTCTSVNLTTKQLNFLRYYAMTHDTTVSEVLKNMINQLARKERLREIEDFKKVKAH